MEKLKYKDITEKIIYGAFEVHNFLGNGFQEVIYQRALAYEFRAADLQFHREIEQEIFYKELEEPIGTRRADFVVEEKILVELKAVKEFNDIHHAQVLSYLKLANLQLGLLLNFNVIRLKQGGIKRVANNL